MRAITASLLLAGAVALTGCGPDQGAFTLQDFRSAIGGVLSRNADDGPSLRERLTPQTLATLDGAILLIELPERDAEAGAQIVRSTRGHTTWATQNAITFTERRGIVTATRGLGGDLMSADISEVVQAVHGRRADAVRVHRYLDGEEQIVARAYVCDYSREGGQSTATLTGTFRTTKVTETCTNTQLTVENHYWIDGSGTVRASKQWIGVFVGYVLTERIND